MTDFAGFSETGLDFLTELGSKDKTWFDANRQTYDGEVVPAAKAFVVAMGDALHEAISDSIEAQPKTNGSIAPINNDLRFNPDASPYKDHLMFKFWEGPDKKTAATLWVRLHPVDGVGFASGINIADVDGWRTAIADDSTGAPFASSLDALARKNKAEVVGQGLKRVPKPFAEDHPRGELLKHKGFQVRWQEPVPKSVHRATFVDWCTNRLVRCADVHAWLVGNVA